MKELQDLALAHKEHERWLKLMLQLGLTKAITKADAESPINERKTPGQELIHRIKEWAYAYADLCEANPEVKKNR